MLFLLYTVKKDSEPNSYKSTKEKTAFCVNDTHSFLLEQTKNQEIALI